MKRKMAKRNQNRKLNNKGMTLVEVIIAVTILSIVIAPTLSILTNAMTYNLKARKRQNATLTAEAIMESFKGYDLETLKSMFKNNGVSDKDGRKFFGDNVAIDVNGESKEYQSMVEGSYGVTGSEDSDEYVFTIDGYNDNGRKYDVEIKVEPSNSADLYIQYNMNKLNAAVYKGKKDESDSVESLAIKSFIGVVPEGDDEEVVSGDDIITDDFEGLLKLATKECTGTNKPTDINGVKITKKNHTIEESNIVIKGRKLIFDISDSDGYAVVTPKIVYEYYIKDYVFYSPTEPLNPDDPYPDGEDIIKDKGGALYASVEKVIERFPQDTSDFLTLEMDAPTAEELEEICQNIESDKLERLYIYYYPYYESGATDTIEIDNNLSNNVDCYVVKQKDRDLSKTKCTTLESGYEPKLEITGNAVIYHNLNINLGNNKNYSKITNVANKYYDIADLNESYKAFINDDMRDNKNVLYDITLTMKDAETGKDVAKLTSVMYEK